MAQAASLTTSAERPLLDDWRLRRDKLLESGVHDALKSVLVRVLDFLIKRYDGTPEGNSPARFPLQSNVRFDRRAIVVHHHLGIGKVAGVKSESEASGRVAKLTANLRAMRIQENLKPVGSKIPFAPAAPGQLKEVLHALLTLFIAVICAGALVAITVGIFEFLNLRGVSFGYAIAFSLVGSPLAFLLVAGLFGYVIDRLFPNLFPTIKVPVGPPETPDKRPQLADGDSAVRVSAIQHTGAFGTLDDVGLLSDLLALPPQSDEDSRERPALLAAIEAISQRQTVRTFTHGSK